MFVVLELQLSDVILSGRLCVVLHAFHLLSITNNQKIILETFLVSTMNSKH